MQNPVQNPVQNAVPDPVQNQNWASPMGENFELQGTWEAAAKKPS